MDKIDLIWWQSNAVALVVCINSYSQQGWQEIKQMETKGWKQIKLSPWAYIGWLQEVCLFQTYIIDSGVNKTISQDHPVSIPLRALKSIFELISRETKKIFFMNFVKKSFLKFFN